MAAEAVFRSFIVVDKDRLGDFLGDDFPQFLLLVLWGDSNIIVLASVGKDLFYRTEATNFLEVAWGGFYMI